VPGGLEIIIEDTQGAGRPGRESPRRLGAHLHKKGEGYARGEQRLVSSGRRFDEVTGLLKGLGDPGVGLWDVMHTELDLGQEEILRNLLQGTEKRMNSPRMSPSNPGEDRMFPW